VQFLYKFVELFRCYWFAVDHVFGDRVSGRPGNVGKVTRGGGNSKN